MLLRLALAGPRCALRLADTTRGAADGAFRASVALTRAVAERRRLAPDEGDDSPGALSRIPPQECLALLAGRSVGRLAYVARAEVPEVVPVNYVVHDGAVLLRSGVGPKLQAAERRAVVAFEVDHVDETTRTGWSVVAHGRARRLTGAEREALPVGVLPVAWARGPRLAVVRIEVARLDGRRLS